MYLKELLEAGSAFLRKRNVEEPLRNAEIILSHILKKPIYCIYTEDIPPSPGIIKLYNKLLIKRAGGVPLQYLIKQVNFYGYDFYIEKGVFIPRPETEILVEKTIEISRRRFSQSKRIKILDIGTGCGNIAIVLARKIKNCSIVATDASEKAIRISKYNAEIHRVKDKIKFLKANIFPSGKRRFHIIVSNPPYIPYSEISSLSREVQKEPLRALSGGVDGLSIIKKILRTSDMFLYNNGVLLMEIGYGQSETIRKMKSKLIFKTIEKDLSGIERIAIFCKRIS